MSLRKTLPPALASAVVSEPLFGWPIVGAEGANAVAGALRSGVATDGEEPEAIGGFETAFAAAQGADHAVAVTSGAHAIGLICEVLGIGVGDVVFVSGLSSGASAQAVADVNALPWPVDVESQSWTMSATKLEAAVDRATRQSFRPRAVIAAHRDNRMADLDALGAICARRGLELIEDATHAPGARWRRRGAGTVGIAGAFSLRRSSVITTGEGGMVTTQDAYLAACVRSARDRGRPVALPVGGARPEWVERWRTDLSPGADLAGPSVSVPSGCYWMSGLQGAFGIEQLEAFVRLQQPLRRRVMDELDEAAGWIDGVAPLAPQPEVTSYPQHRWAMRFEPRAWGGLPAAAARVILSAKLGGIGVGAPSRSLDQSAVYRPHDKPARHRLSKRYWELVDPRPYSLAGADAARLTVITFDHRWALDQGAPEQLSQALQELRQQLSVALRWWRTHGIDE